MTGLSRAFLDDLARVAPPAESSPTLPPAAYRDAGALAAERDALFLEGWIGIGRADQWRAAGDYRALDVGGVPVLVLRDRAGGLRAFANACRHRGSMLLEGAGNVARVVCPFHAWTYGLDGALEGAPRMARAAGFDAADHGLVAFRAEERAGFAFVRLDGGEGGIDARLGDFEAVHAPWPLASLVTTRRRELEVGCNWKLFLEVFNEYYHLPCVHGGTFGSIYGEPDPPDEAEGAFVSQFGVTEGSGGLTRSDQKHGLPAMPGLTGRPGRGVRYTWVYPSMTFAAGAEAVWVYEARPLAPDRCHVVMSVCFPPETIAGAGFGAKAARYYARMDAALEEDRVALERQQAGLTSPFARQGRFGDLEPGVARFAFWYAATMLARRRGGGPDPS